MKVLHLLTSNRYSGAENVAITIIKVTHNDYQSLYVSPKGDIESNCIQNNIPYKGIEKFTINNIRKVIKEFKPDIIHAHDFRATTKCVLTFTKIPIISHLHNNPPWIQKLNFNSIIYAVVALKCKKILGVSDAIRKEYIFSKLIESKWNMISNPFDSGRVIEMSTQGNADIEDRNIDLVFLGRLTEQKDPFRFIEIVEMIKYQNPNIRCIMIGDGVLRKRCEQLIQNKGLSENIKCIGFLDNPFYIMKSAKLFVMPSKWEGYGLGALEAMTLGLPVLATPVGGLKNIVNSKSGLLCSTNEAFVEEILYLLENNEIRQSKSLAARQRVREIVNIKEYKQKLDGIYKEVIEE